MNTLLWKGNARVYYNAFEEAPLVWSVDDGDPATEVKTDVIFVLSHTLTQTGPRNVQPKAWMRCEEVEIHRMVGGAIMIRSVGE
jgi:hypothetical protein